MFRLSRWLCQGKICVLIFDFVQHVAQLFFNGHWHKYFLLLEQAVWASVQYIFLICPWVKQSSLIPYIFLTHHLEFNCLNVPLRDDSYFLERSHYRGALLYALSLNLLNLIATVIDTASHLNSCNLFTSNARAYLRVLLLALPACIKLG